MEIETGKSDALANIRKCLRVEFDLVLSVVTTQRLKYAIAAAVESLGQERNTARVVTAVELLDHERSIQRPKETSKTANSVGR